MTIQVNSSLNLENNERVKNEFRNKKDEDLDNHERANHVKYTKKRKEI